MRVDQAKRLKELELENTRLKKLVGDLSLDNAMLKEASRRTPKPAQETGHCQACHKGIVGLGTAGMQGAWTGQSHAAPGVAPTAGLGAPYRRHHRPGEQVRQIWLPEDRRSIEQRIELAGESQEGGKDMEKRGVQGAEEATEAGQIVAE